MKPIPDYPDYAITTDGRVFRTTSRTNAKAGREVKQGTMTSGYKYARISKTGEKAKAFGVHCLILLTYVGEKPTTKHQGAHLNGNRLDNRLENLMWVTPKENAHHKRLHGTHIEGEQNIKSKLSEEGIMKIYKLRSEGKSSDEVAELFGISSTLILRIEKGVAWKHLNIPRFRERRSMGSKCHNALITEDQVLQIREKHNSGMTQRALGREFGVHYSNINAIVLRKTWKHI